MHKIVKSTLTALAVLASSSASLALAQPADISTINQSEIIPYLNSKTVEPALKTVTGNHLASINAQQQEFITATATNGLQFEIRFTNCEGEKPIKCKAMGLLSTWEKPKKAKKLNKQIAAFLIDHPLSNAGVLDDGSPYVYRHVIADFGAPQGNLVSEFANFIRDMTSFGIQLQGK